MKRVLVVLALLALLATAAYGSAATLAVNGGSIQAGLDATLYCDSDGVAVAGWGLETDNGKVYYVKIGGVDGACVGNSLFIRVEDSSGNKLASGSATIASGVTEYKFSFNPAVDAAAIEKLKVWIEGPAGLN